MKEQREAAMETKTKSMEWAIVSKYQLLDWYQVTNEETAMCSQGLSRLHFGFGFIL